jgi:cell division control protein 7
MWAAGIILLCILSGCYPFFRSPDDLSALAEIMTVFGTEKIKKLAVKLGESLFCNMLPTYNNKNVKVFIVFLNRHIQQKEL